jgi:hypothetical protein
MSYIGAGREKTTRSIMTSGVHRELRLGTNFTAYGKTLVRGEGRIFGAVLHNFSSAVFDAQIRFALFREGEMVEQYPVYNLPPLEGGGRWDGFGIPCFVNAPPGVYHLKALLRSKGDTAWFVPAYAERVEESDWVYVVREPTTTPSLTSVRLEGERTHDSLIRFVKEGEGFNILYYLSNREGKALHGEIKAVWERSFDGFYNKAQDDGQSWSDEIGRIRIDLEDGTVAHEGQIPCRIREYHPNVSRFMPAVHLYYRPEGSFLWKLMQNDCDFLFTLLMGVEEYRPKDGDGTVIHAPSVSRILAEYQTTNYVYLALE